MVDDTTSSIDAVNAEIAREEAKLLIKLTTLHIRMTAIGSNDMGVLTHRNAGKFHRATQLIEQVCSELNAKRP